MEKKAPWKKLERNRLFMYTADLSTMIFRSWLTTPQSSSAVLLIMKKHIIHVRSAIRKMLISNAHNKVAGEKFTYIALKRPITLYRSNPTSLNAGTIVLAVVVMVILISVMSLSPKISLDSKSIAKYDKSKVLVSKWQEKIHSKSAFIANIYNNNALAAKIQKNYDVEVFLMSFAQPTNL